MSYLTNSSVTITGDALEDILSFTGYPNGLTTVVPVSSVGLTITQKVGMMVDGIVISGGELQGSTAKSLLNLSQTWVTAGLCDAIKVSITDTVSHVASTLFKGLVGGSIKFEVDKTGDLYITGGRVVTSRRTGYTNAMTGTANRATAYATSTITLVQLAERVKAIQDDLTTHGLIGA